MEEKDYLKIVIPELIYAGVLIFFLVRLNNLNKELLERYPDKDWLSILTHNNNQPMWYFVYALLFVIGAVGLGIYAFYLMRNDYLSSAANLSCVSSMIINAVEIFWIIKFIDNPILRAVLAGIVVIGIGGYAFSESN
ncbi:hypothetical protein A5881_004027 [Enterococcus termitis]|nr:hypothetical protein A5881_003906 [Enterococcus termitis]